MLQQRLRPLNARSTAVTAPRILASCNHAVCAPSARQASRAVGRAAKATFTSTSVSRSVAVLTRRSRLLTVKARADASHSDEPQHNNSSDEPLYLPATAATYCPFSAELLLATTRLGHLERYREEVQQLYEPGQPVDLARVALLISNIFQPQLDHRPYFDALEHLVAAAALAVMRKVSAVTVGPRSSEDSCSGFEGLDIKDPQHVLCAVQAINELLFVEEGLQVNAADPYDPLNGSLADLLDTHKGNQWTLAVVYLHILDGLGLPHAVVGSPERIFVRVGEPPLLVQHSNTPGSTPAVYLVDMAQPGVVFAYPPPVPADSTSSGNSSLQPAHSVASNGSVSSTSSSARVSDEWNKALHSFLKHKGAADLDTTGSSHPEAEEPQTSSSTTSSSNDRSDEFVDGSTTDDSSSWLELESYAAQDAATRNSWKALYGPGALAEWGGLVSSNLHYYNNIASDSSWDGGEAGTTIGGMRAGEWLGVLDSPFAAAAHEPFPGDEAEGASTAAAAAAAAADGAEADLTSVSSMDTSCGSPVGSVDIDAASSSPDSSSGSWQGGHVAGVPVLSWADVAAIGGLQPVSKRLMLQQMLGGMKLSLMMSGRQDELLLVLRYLRATDPFSLPDLRDMALCLAEQRPEEAAPLLRDYLAVAPGAPDADMVREVQAQVQLRVQLGRAKGWH